MPQMTRQELQEENDALRSKLEAAHDLIAEALGYDDQDDLEEEDSDEGEDD